MGKWPITGSLMLTTAIGTTGCGGSSFGGPSPIPPEGLAATITITASGASPKHVVVGRGSQVLFINSDSRDHQMFSDPHPEHTDCPAFDQVGALAPGQSRATGNLNTARTCGFHDHIHFAEEALKGTVTVE